jgi:hypothetical protein
LPNLEKELNQKITMYNLSLVLKMKIKNCLIKIALLSLVAIGISKVDAAPENKPIQELLPNYPSFKDIPNGHWARESSNKLLGSGILEGNNRDEFRGNDFMTRYEFSIAMARLAYATVCVLPPPPNELIYAKKDDKY